MNVFLDDLVSRKDYFIRGCDYSPCVEFRYSEHKLIMRGICVPEDPTYLFEHINLKLKHFKSHLHVEFDLNYFNTSSSKYILALLNNAKELLDNKVEVTWITDMDDIDMEETGELLEEITDLNFIFKTK